MQKYLDVGRKNVQNPCPQRTDRPVFPKTLKQNLKTSGKGHQQCYLISARVNLLLVAFPTRVNRLFETSKPCASLCRVPCNLSQQRHVPTGCRLSTGRLHSCMNYASRNACGTTKTSAEHRLEGQLIGSRIASASVRCCPSSFMIQAQKYAVCHVRMR